MRVLVIDEEFPYPLDSGKRIRSYQLLSRLTARCKLHYLAYGTAHSEGFSALERAGISPRPVAAELPAQSGPGFYLRLLANLFSRYPYIVSRHYSRLFQNHLRAAVAEIQPDLILCEWTPYAVFASNIIDIPHVIVAHNIEHRIWQRYYEYEESALKKWYIGRQAPKVATFEREAFGRADGAVAVSKSEADEIRSMNDRLKVAVVENGVDLDYFAPSPDRENAEALVFVGAMHWRPNQDAVIFFVEEILPRIRQHRPDVTFTIVGQGPPPHIQKLDSRPGVRVTGRVEDVRPYVGAAAVYVVPLRIGGGTRLKILEALAMKKAVVATSVGAEGLEVVDDRHLLLADSADSFAEQVLRLLEDAALRRGLGDAGRRLVEERYGWDRLADKLYEYLSELVKQRKGTRHE